MSSKLLTKVKPWLIFLGQFKNELILILLLATALSVFLGHTAEVMIEFFKAYNFRSDRASVLQRPLANRWLNTVILAELLILVLIIYLPFFQLLLGTFSISAVDWMLTVGLAFSITPVPETLKWLTRRGWLETLA